MGEGVRNKSHLSVRALTTRWWRVLEFVYVINGVKPKNNEKETICGGGPVKIVKAEGLNSCIDVSYFGAFAQTLKGGEGPTLLPSTDSFSKTMREH